MTDELKAYIRIETVVAAAFNFFINGMIAALVYHKADYVPTDAISICIDLVLTCLLMFILCACFCRASLKRTKTAGLLEGGSALLRRAGRLLRYSLLYGFVLGILAAIILSAVTVPLFTLLGIYALPFDWYVVLKVLFTALLAGGITRLTLYAGIFAP
jgi:hypothetical protein